MSRAWPDAMRRRAVTARTARPAAVWPRAVAGCADRPGMVGRRAVTGRVQRDGERGSATVWVLAVGLCVVAVGGFGAQLGAAVVARHQAQAAADLGALSAAVHAMEGEVTACGYARRTVAANHAALVFCRLEGMEAVVSAQVSAAGLAGYRPARAGARAGPAWTA